MSDHMKGIDAMWSGHLQWVEEENAALQREVKDLRAALAVAREALEFYAAEATYTIPAGEGWVADFLSATCPAQDDIGEKARAALAALQDEGEK